MCWAWVLGLHVTGAERWPAATVQKKYSAWKQHTCLQAGDLQTQPAQEFTAGGRLWFPQSRGGWVLVGIGDQAWLAHKLLVLAVLQLYGNM